MARCIIIAEAGVNHNGSLATAKALVEVAAGAGADYVKFQTFKADKLVTRTAQKAAYQKANLNDVDESQYSMLRRLELSESDHIQLQEYSRQCNIKFLSTAFDEDGLDFLESLKIDMFKIPSGEITNLPYLKKVAQKGKQTIMSTGMASLDEIEAAMAVLLANGLARKDITVLHCNTQYPTPFRDVNLGAMTTIRKALNVNVGYSDHTMGIEVPIAAVALGATCIEKHFTLDRTMEGPDHKASLEPVELTAMVSAIRNIELAIDGSGLKVPSPSEIENKVIARKSIHTRHELPEGHILQESDLIMKRPGNGISPMDIHVVVGKKLVRRVESDTMLTFEHLC
jgi:N-acetylneuraminate synthase/N,N'-diacetyllegionaminate synthase